MTADDFPPNDVLKDRADVPPAQFHRDMRRLLDLREQYDRLGLNTVESREAQRLTEKYGVVYNEWTRGNFPRGTKADYCYRARDD